MKKYLGFDLNEMEVWLIDNYLRKKYKRGETTPKEFASIVNSHFPRQYDEAKAKEASEKVKEKLNGQDVS